MCSLSKLSIAAALLAFAPSSTGPNLVISSRLLTKLAKTVTSSLRFLSTVSVSSLTWVVNLAASAAASFIFRSVAGLHRAALLSKSAIRRFHLVLLELQRALLFLQ